MNGAEFSIPMGDESRQAPPPPDVTITDDGRVIPPELASEPPKEKILGKFDSVDDLVKSYTELEKKLGARQESKAPAIETPPAKAEEQKAETQVDINSIAEEYAQTGTLTKEHYAALEAKGFDKQTVDNYVEGQKARAVQLRADLAAVAGGEEAMQKVLSWAQQGLSESEQKAYNDALATRNPELAKIALQGVVAKYEKARPAEPERLNGSTGGSGNAGPQPFANQSEMLVAMRDKRYATDPVYRRSVEQRTMVSTFQFG
jgi:hypothetical protein